MNKFIAIIPSRFGSSRFPGKPLADILGKSMIRRVYEQTSKIFDDVVVATDDKRIYDHVREFGGEVVMTSSDHESGTDRCAEALLKIQSQKDETYDFVINVQGDEPFIDPYQLNDLKKVFEDRPEANIATLVKMIENKNDLFNPNKPKVVLGTQNNAIYFSRQAIPYLRSVAKENWLDQHIFYKHIGLYGYRSETLFEITKLGMSPVEKAEKLEQLRWLENGFRIFVAITDIESYGIDTPEDLENYVQAIKSKKI